MKTIKTLKQAYKLSLSQVTVQELINGRMYTSKGWEDVKLSNELKNEIAETVSNYLGGIKRTKERVYNNLMYGKPQHWGLKRFVIECYKNKPPYITYITGQDTTWEMKAIRAALK